MSKTKSTKKERKVCIRFVVNVLLMPVHIYLHILYENHLTIRLEQNYKPVFKIQDSPFRSLWYQ
jgi:hypothetical protein